MTTSPRWARKRGRGVFVYETTPDPFSFPLFVPPDPFSLPSKQIIDDILACERHKDPHGLNGFILLLHVGSERRDKAFLLLEPLLVELKQRGYTFARIDELLKL